MSFFRIPVRKCSASIHASALLVAATSLRRLQQRQDQQQRDKTATTRCEDSSGLEAAARELLKPMVQYAELHGLLYADKSVSPGCADPSLATQCPLAMLPFKMPAQAFHDVVALSPIWNRLVDAVARDRPWLYQNLEVAASADPFTRQLLEISKAVHKEGLRQPIMLGLHRSDYMLHEPSGSSEDAPRLLQVELNTIASSMGSHSANTATVHRYMLSRYACGSDSIAIALRQYYGAKTPGRLLEQLPENGTLEVLPAALAEAHRAYRFFLNTQGVYIAGSTAVVVFVVQGSERNFADQNWLEYKLWEKHGVAVVRKSLREIEDECIMDASSGRLRLGRGAGPEVAVVYFRAGYTPDDYPSPVDWKARALLERSLAIKCPSVDYQLVGAKKIQQALAAPGAVERFVGSSDGAKLRTCFAGLWGLGPGEKDAAIISKAMENPHLYVLKPQREGGGNNYYGDGLAVKLQQMSEEERGAYILMQRILPQPQMSVMTRAGQAQLASCVAEFGFYSVYLGDGKREYLSKHAGHLVRTKSEDTDEGGVAAGFAVINSPFLVE